MSAIGQLRDKVENRLNEEIIKGNYSIVKDSPRIISALAAIEKPNGDVRLIHDLSRPTGYGVNDYAKKDPCNMQSVYDALACLKPDYFMAKIDLSWAYRSVCIKKAEQVLTGLEWKFRGNTESTFLQDCKLPFGGRKSPSIFNRLTQSVRRMMERRGYTNCVVYLDDFFIAEESFNKCMEVMNTLIALLRQLGFRINWSKVVDPCKELVFLGININTTDNWIALDPEKKEKLIELLNACKARKRMSKAQLLSIAGKLNWAATVFPWGRNRLNNIFQLIRNLNNDNHKAITTSALAEDFDWWLKCLGQNKNRRQIWDDYRPSLHIATDSSQVSGGAFCFDSGAWQYCNWILDRHELAEEHINIKELAMIAEAVSLWAPLNQGSQLVIYTDNTFAAIATNKGTARNKMAQALLREMANTALINNVTILAHYIPGAINDFADSISRLHSPGQIERFLSLLINIGYHCTPPLTWCPYNMSALSLTFLLPQIRRWQESCNSWTRKWQKYKPTS